MNNKADTMNFTLEQAHSQVNGILNGFYAQNSSIRHDPLFIALKMWLVQLQAVIDQETDMRTRADRSDVSITLQEDWEEAFYEEYGAGMEIRY